MKKKRYSANIVTKQVSLHLTQAVYDDLEFIRTIHNLDCNQIVQTAVIHFLRCASVEAIFSTGCLDKTKY